MIFIKEQFTMSFQGVYTAIVTPFGQGKIDYDTFAALIERQIAAGISGIVPCGTTGESPTLSHKEHRELIEKTVQIVKGRVKVIAGTGSNSTAEAIELTQHAEKSGVDGALLVNPYYNKPTQEGLFQHFSTIADNTSLECVLYNIPGRTAVNCQPETIARLAQKKNINTVKEATGDINQASRILELANQMTILSGDDSLTLPLIAIGAKGVISVLSNLMPDKMVALVKAALNMEMANAQKLHAELFPFMRSMFLETNPIPIKAALSNMGWIANELRLPLTPLSTVHDQELKKMMKSKGLIN
jgi:4-hydroxy-tetrahydrodipicolinate synthase